MAGAREKWICYMITWIKRKEKMPVEQFDEVEARLGMQFPQDYVNWVQQYSGPERVVGSSFTEFIHALYVRADD
jgi:hypothetical protein